MRGFLDLWRDLRYGCRLLARNPAFALVAVTTLGLALGANTAVFSLVHKVLIAYLPVQDPERLVVLSRSNLEQAGITRFAYPLFRELESERDIFDGILCRGGSERVTVGTDAGGEPATGELISGSYFEVLGVRPHIGRLIARTDDVTPGAHPVVVLSHRYWQRHFSGDPAVVGRTLRLSGYPMTVVGVSPPGFDGLDPGQAVDLRVPIAMQAELRRAPSSLGQRRVAELTIVGRLRPGVRVEDARHALSARLRRYLDDGNASERLDLLPAAGGIGLTRRQYETSLRVLMVITASVLVVACLNVANLLLARASTRAHEFAVRLAVGAGSGRLVRQLLIENVVLSLVAATLGALLAYPGTQVLIRLMSIGGSAVQLNVKPHGAVLVFHVATTAASVALFGLFPAVASRRRSLTPDLKATVAGRSSVMGRRLFVGVQVALSVVVLVGALLFLRTVHALRTADMGFRADHLLMLALSPKNAGQSDAQVLPFFRDVRERVNALPGVTAATYGMVRPVSNASWRTPVVMSGCCPQNAARAARNVVGPEYFETLEIPRIAGRDFTEQDRADAPKVAIVNESFARLYGPGRDPIGTKIGVERPEYTVVGVVKDAKYAHVRETPPPVWYVPYEQQPNVKYLDLYVRTGGDPERMKESVRAAIASIDRSVAMFDVWTLSDQIDDLLVAERTVAALATFFGFTAAVLAALGVYGILAFLVTQRRREIGIRMALGARPAAIVRMVTRDAGPAVGCGLVAGAVLAAALGRYTASLLYGVTPLDVFSLAGGVLVMAALAALAASLPARRASRVDPVQALRES
jgi:predicted permease